jgi:hypothetical protein
MSRTIPPRRHRIPPFTVWLRSLLAAAVERLSGGLSSFERADSTSYNRDVTAFAGCPGADLVEQGLADLEAGRDSEAALLVSIGAPRLTQLGVALPRTIPDAEHRLYLLLSERDADGAHSRYNALVRRLVSFERALGCAS